MMAAPAPDTIPVTPVRWPAAYRLRPASVPETQPSDKFGADGDSLQQLMALTSPLGRHQRGVVPLAFTGSAAMPDTVVSAFAHPAPEWQFADGTLPHMLLAETMAGAIENADLLYGQFLKDTEEGDCRLTFILERFQLEGRLHSVEDRARFESCYDRHDYSAAHQMVTSLHAAGADGLVFAGDTGKSAVVLNPDCLSRCARERALALAWDGVQFTRYYDYRDLHWVSIADSRFSRPASC